MIRPLICAFALLLMSGCTTASRSPDAIRSDTAAATAAAARDAKAVAQGVIDGLRTRGPLNINRASEADLEALPGIDAPTAQRIIAGRPYTNAIELRQRHIVSKSAYDQIANKIEAR
jgi:DNA uptake protein ComE-like DNA-binding protein